MNPPPSYHEILNLLNKSKRNEMKMMDEIYELKRQLEIAHTNVKEIIHELGMICKGYNEDQLKNVISKL